ncbi:hypothetical protein RJ639_012627 [Escallonia herrerae]|uniref:Uncharacterized protein n=1 Tax=Escallonia herrerae TaxID=1293975 RepID=A0AA89AQX5_9ASTE|nr:hypothetical protein RJ639_012627 [Escallonia herrerae]
MAGALATRAASMGRSTSFLRLSVSFVRKLSASAAPNPNSPPPAEAKKPKRKKKKNLFEDGRHGKAWGIVHKGGLPAADSPKKISGVHKRCWKYVKGLKNIEESAPKPKIQAA